MIKQRIIANFRHPKGIFGRIAGRIMATRATNVSRNLWVADVLDPPPDARICEIGHGPGLAIERLWPALTTGEIVGIEISELMSRTAARRNQAGIDAGRVQFRVGDSAALPDDIDNFDLIYGVNASMFWTDTSAAISGLTERLNPGGELVLVYMPPPTSDTPATEIANQYATHFTRAGLTDVRQDRLDSRPPTIATRGRFSVRGTPGGGAPGRP